jgi:hypothetical protein
VVDLARLGADVAALAGAGAVHDLDGPAGRAHEGALVAEVEDPGGAVEQHGLDDGLVEQIGRGGRGDQGAVGHLEHGAEGVLAHQHGQQGLGPLAIRGGGGRPAGHLDEGVVAALGRGAGQMGDGHRLAVHGLGRGPIGLEQPAFEPVELAADLGLGGGGELPGQQPGAPQPVVE